MFTNGHDIENEGATHLNNKINDFRGTLADPKLGILFKILDNGFPIVPFPKVESCLGMSPSDSAIKIKDGFVVMAFDFDVSSSHADCLFNMAETLKQKELRLAEAAAKGYHPGVAYAERFG